MSAPFWSAYRSSKRPSEVEEPSDWIQRPLGYVFAKLVMPTPLTPNAVTLLAMASAIGGGISLGARFHGHLQAAGALLLLSAILDASDGQLARMRGTASPYGRMLDGLADLVGAVASVGGAAWYFWDKWHAHWWVGVGILIASAATAVTGSFHTGLYDHYKNVWMRLTYPNNREGEGSDEAMVRATQRPAREGMVRRIAWAVYLFYVKSQADVVRGYDRFTTPDLARLPAYTEARAAIYRREAARAMNTWRLLFGFGTVVVGMALFAALDLLEVYMVGRLVILNVVFYGWLRGEQRRASRVAFAEMKVSFDGSLDS